MRKIKRYFYLLKNRKYIKERQKVEAERKLIIDMKLKCDEFMHLIHLNYKEEIRLEDLERLQKMIKFE